MQINNGQPPSEYSIREPFHVNNEVERQQVFYQPLMMPVPYPQSQPYFHPMGYNPHYGVMHQPPIPYRMPAHPQEMPPLIPQETPPMHETSQVVQTHPYPPMQTMPREPLYYGPPMHMQTYPPYPIPQPRPHLISYPAAPLPIDPSRVPYPMAHYQEEGAPPLPYPHYPFPFQPCFSYPYPIYSPKASPSEIGEVGEEEEEMKETTYSSEDNEEKTPLSELQNVLANDVSGRIREIPEDEIFNADLSLAEELGLPLENLSLSEKEPLEKPKNSLKGRVKVKTHYSEEDYDRLLSAYVSQIIATPKKAYSYRIMPKTITKFENWNYAMRHEPPIDFLKELAGLKHQRGVFNNLPTFTFPCFILKGTNAHSKFKSEESELQLTLHKKESKPPKHLFFKKKGSEVPSKRSLIPKKKSDKQLVVPDYTFGTTIVAERKQV